MTPNTKLGNENIDTNHSPFILVSNLIELLFQQYKENFSLREIQVLSLIVHHMPHVTVSY